MSWLDRMVISRVSPSWALKRSRARMAYKAFAEYEAVAPSRLRKERKNRKSANAENDKSAADLRSMARHMEQNLDIASGALDVLVANTIGTGIQPEPQVELKTGEPAEGFNRALLRLWDDWIYCPEVTQQMDYYTLQRLTARSFYRDGDVFGQQLMGPIPMLDHGTILPYSLELLEADYVPLGLTDQSRSIIQGIETNGWGRPRAYWVYKSHPGETMMLNIDVKRVPADRMFHLKMVKRLHQLRGISVFAPAIARMDDIKEIDESERVAARVAAAMAGYIKKGSPDLYVPAVGGDGQPELRNMEYVPGMIFDDLLPGEEIGTISSNRPNNALIPFRDSQLRSAAAGLMTGYSSLSKNYNGTYSAQRQELVEQFVNYRMLTGYFCFRFCQRVWDGFIDTVRITGAIEIPRDVDLSTLYNASHTPPPMPWIDPVKEMQANEIAEDRGWKSRPGIIRERGANPDQVNREILQDAQERERLGLELGGPERAASDQAAQQAEADREAADERDMRREDNADARTERVVQAVCNAPPPMMNVTTGTITVEPAKLDVHNHVAPAAVTVEAAPAPVVNITTPEQVINLEATVEAPIVNVAAPQVDVHMPKCNG